MSRINGYHHLTMSTDGAQEDFDFYTKALGLHSVKRTVLFDGVIPVYHLYYGSPKGDASTNHDISLSQAGRIRSEGDEPVARHPTVDPQGRVGFLG
jgi:catechol 2,3-dioxygenase-like lactoylglutathione lyase family enzyme